MSGTIVVGADGSPNAAEALDRAAELARAHDAAVHVVGPYGRTGAWRRDGARAGSRSQPQAVAAVAAGSADGLGELDVHAHARRAAATAALCAVAAEADADLIVVPVEGLSRALLRHAPCPVEAVGHRPPGASRPLTWHPARPAPAPAGGGPAGLGALTLLDATLRRIGL